ncbi:PaaI family thioesterase [Paenibacillus chartarius]|uniref:PaaI family thioesterase n=1 Tax=Paenibacillus chartarius TaxID=747481 RepID=A0ABV6DPS0_9BACL
MGEAAEPTFWGYLGCRFVSAEQDGSRVVIGLDIQPHHLNMLGIIHGGVLSSLLDNAMGIAVMLARPDSKVVTTNLNVHFVSSLRGGKLTVSAEIVHQSRRMITATGSVYGEAGQLTAMGTGTFRIIE